ncbi:hypothetical protein J5N97_025251 [Dioscorea zingiberensis]|uniref:Uncharacterized protein n=1 Tax=Dioscorea zingiberensis TaxID=325984 RepID=A0A9D5C9C9_9LILI|nr:hypothetical protein J5N97_025224 [Dioscorea zingiberensis]KAJ0968334.1 hypothetical protein J5N97_025251 [Dioscorea zingiberensis]
MERSRCGQPVPTLRKSKKKQAKDEVDRQKQAEKKKRRLEKALATSAAIRSELEKKKQKKIEEQQRLDEEGAALAEAVALHVLVGEDTDESRPFMLNERLSPWDYSSNISLLMGCQDFAKYSVGGGWMPDAYDTESKWNDWVNASSPPHGLFVRDLRTPYFKETFDGAAAICPGRIAAEAVSLLQIKENPQKIDPTGAASVVINKMFGGSNEGNRMNLYKF